MQIRRLVSNENQLRIAQLLGLPNDTVMSISLDPHGWTAELLVCDKQGHAIAFEDDALTVTVSGEWVRPNGS